MSYLSSMYADKASGKPTVGAQVRYRDEGGDGFGAYQG